MPANGYNIGRDIALDIIDPIQGPIRFSIKTKFKSTPKFTELTSKGLDGVNRFTDIPEGWDLEFELDRGDSVLDKYFAANEAAYFAGQVIPHVSITETITNPDLTVSVFKYTGVSMRISSGGSWASDAKVEQMVSARARRRLSIS